MLKYNVIAENIHTGELRKVGDHISENLANLVAGLWNFGSYIAWKIDTETGEIS